MNAYKKEPVVFGFDAYKDVEQLSKIILDSMSFVRILKSFTLHVLVCNVYTSGTSVLMSVFVYCSSELIFHLLAIALPGELYIIRPLPVKRNIA